VEEKIEVSSFTIIDSGTNHHFAEQGKGTLRRESGIRKDWEGVRGREGDES